MCAWRLLLLLFSGLAASAAHPDGRPTQQLVSDILHPNTLAHTYEHTSPSENHPCIHNEHQPTQPTPHTSGASDARPPGRPPANQLRLAHTGGCNSGVISPVQSVAPRRCSRVCVRVRAFWLASQSVRLRLSSRKTYHSAGRLTSSVVVSGAATSSNQLRSAATGTSPSASTCWVGTIETKRQQVLKPQFWVKGLPISEFMIKSQRYYTRIVCLTRFVPSATAHSERNKIRRINR